MTENIAFSNVINPVYANPQNTAISCVVTLSDDSEHQYAGQTHSFTATANDPMPYGAALWADLIAGEYGPIGPYVAPTPTPIQLAAQAIAGGIEVTSTSNSALDGTYPVDALTQVKLNSAITYIMMTGAFPPESATTMPWYDAEGNMHTFTSVTTFKAFATAFADFVAQVDIYANSNGQSGSIPSNAITIP